MRVLGQGRDLEWGRWPVSYGRGTGFTEEVKGFRSASPLHSAPSFTLASPHTPPLTHTAVWAPALYPEVILLEGRHRDKK